MRDIIHGSKLTPTEAQVFVVATKFTVLEIEVRVESFALWSFFLATQHASEFGT